MRAMTLVLIFLATQSSAAWGEAQGRPKVTRNPANMELVNKQLKETAFEQEYDAQRASAEFQKNHGGKIQLEDTSRKEVFLGDDFQAAPSFTDINGQVDPAQSPTVLSGPRSDVAEKRYSDWSKNRERKSYRETLNRLYHDNLRRAGIRDDKRDLASELEQLEKKTRH